MDSKEGKREIIATKEKTKENSARRKYVAASGEKPKATHYISKDFLWEIVHWHRELIVFTWVLRNYYVMIRCPNSRILRIHVNAFSRKKKNFLKQFLLNDRLKMSYRIYIMYKEKFYSPINSKELFTYRHLKVMCLFWFCVK